jgi:polar amino acid transport system permease protein
MDDLLLSPDQYARLWEATQVTLSVLAAAFVLGVVLSLVFGVLRLSDNRIVRGFALAYVEFARGISAIVLLFVMAYAIPILLGLPQEDVFVLASIALGLNMGGYGAEIIRGAILSVPRGQTEAAIALNLTKPQRLRYVVLPQSMRVILPPMGNLTIEILKGTALVSLVSLADITFQTDLIITNQATGSADERIETWILWLNALVIYFVIAQVINGVFRLVEGRVESMYESRTGALPTATAGGEAS